MNAATATAGFQSEVTTSGWGHLLHEECGKWTSFLNPTDERIHWYQASHRCGPAGSEWHECWSGAADTSRTETPVSSAAWMRSMSRYLGTRPRVLMKDPTVWPAVQELAQTLSDRFPEAFAVGGQR